MEAFSHKFSIALAAILIGYKEDRRLQKKFHVDKLKVWLGLYVAHRL